MYKPIYNKQEEMLHTNKYYNTKALDCPTFKYYESIDKDTIDLYVITFNNLFCVEYQIKMLRMFMKQNYNIIIVDNNNNLNQEVSRKTYELCIKENITYVKAPDNYFQSISFDPSMKLGSTMNWIYQNCVKKRQAKYFGYLDQDCFLIKSIWAYLKAYLDTKGMYGFAWPTVNDEIKNEYWLCHIMQNFFRYDFVKDLDLDFRPNGHLGLDTGGCNYPILFKNHKREDYLQNEFLLSDIVGLEWGDVVRDYTLYDDCKWVHIRNSTKAFTNHPNEKHFKEVYMTGILNGILLNNNTSFTPPE